MGHEEGHSYWGIQQQLEATILVWNGTVSALKSGSRSRLRAAGLPHQRSGLRLPVSHRPPLRARLAHYLACAARMAIALGSTSFSSLVETSSRSMAAAIVG
jgi:hypothetical protein